MHSDNHNISQNSADFFLKNLRNISALFIAFEMLEIRYIAQNNHYQLIHQAKMDFLNSLQKILSGIEILVEKNNAISHNFNHEKIFLIRKAIASFDLSTCDLLKVVKEKLDEMTDFTELAEKNFLKINFSENDQIKIRQEVLIVKYEISHSRS